MSINEVGKVYERPWGSYQTLVMADDYQVKILTVAAGGRLSLQRHFHRCEHWVVVAGVPTITVGEVVREYKRNEVAYIPLQAAHRIENFSDQPCELIEVQIGDYLGEDDIERMDDVYGRTQE